MKFKYPLKGEVKLCVCMILINYTCIINLRWCDTLEILLYEKYYTVNGEKKVHKGEKKCKQVNAITLWSGIHVQQNVNIWKKWALNVLNQMITEHHYCLFRDYFNLPHINVWIIQFNQDTTIHH